MPVLALVPFLENVSKKMTGHRDKTGTLCPAWPVMSDPVRRIACIRYGASPDLAKIKKFSDLPEDARRSITRSVIEFLQQPWHTASRSVLVSNGGAYQSVRDGGL